MARVSRDVDFHKRTAVAGVVVALCCCYKWKELEFVGKRIELSCVLRFWKRAGRVDSFEFWTKEMRTFLAIYGNFDEDIFILSYIYFY